MVVEDVEVFRQVHYEKREVCVVCDSPVGKPLIRLPGLPLTELYTRKPVSGRAGFVDQEFCLCNVCGHGQILNIIAPEFLYSGGGYSFRTSQSKTAGPAIDSFLDFIGSVSKEMDYGIIADIGCNDLYMLKKLSGKAKKLLGIDPVLAGRESEMSGGKITVIGDLFENAVAKHSISFDHDLVLSSETLEHIKDPKWLIKTLFENSTENTLFGFQFPGLESMVRDARFDQIFHQHYNYFSLRSVIRMLSELGAELLAYKVNYHHWGDLMIVFRKNPSRSVAWQGRFLPEAPLLTRELVLEHYRAFKESLGFVNKCLEAFKGSVIYGYGASNMLPLLGYHMGDDLSGFAAILDDNPEKDGLYYANLGVGIKRPDSVSDFSESVVVITAVDNARIILPKVFLLNPKRVLVPLGFI
ncbi:methyltransferase domain-containing protein [Candidatus Woesearchaeota archaeon]|nr:methyltransferase domain-containing protein [Candidatus Woesearchaeota archaeon]